MRKGNSITYKVTGRENERWLVEAFYDDGSKAGITVSVKTPSEAWSTLTLLNGYNSEPKVEDAKQAA